MCSFMMICLYSDPGDSCVVIPNQPISAGSLSLRNASRLCENAKFSRAIKAGQKIDLSDRSVLSDRAVAKGEGIPSNTAFLSFHADSSDTGRSAPSAEDEDTATGSRMFVPPPLTHISQVAVIALNPNADAGGRHHGA